jgi:D-glycero-D-manno-heptose 1,7-bisphosphate phosphatase
MFNLKNIDHSWTLFLDRDGVINHEKHLDYILHKDEFRFYEKVTDAIRIFDSFFEIIVMVTNQKGVGKGLMTVEALHDIHGYMLTEIENAEGRINKVYYCDDLSDDHPNRKPNPGMAFQAKKDFPQIDLSTSIMVGNKLSDMRFGRNAGMHTVFLATTNPETPFPHPDIDLRYNSLFEFASALQDLNTKNP